MLIPSSGGMRLCMPLNSTVSNPADVGAIPLLMWIMKDREPMKLKTVASVHNAILFFLSLYMVTETLYQVWSVMMQPEPAPPLYKLSTET